jgi:hypothetical protein
VQLIFGEKSLFILKSNQISPNFNGGRGGKGEGGSVTAGLCVLATLLVVLVAS